MQKNYALRITNYALFITHYALFIKKIMHYALRITNYLLPLQPLLRDDSMKFNNLTTKI